MKLNRSRIITLAVAVILLVGVTGWMLASGMTTAPAISDHIASGSTHSAVTSQPVSSAPVSSLPAISSEVVSSEVSSEPEEEDAMEPAILTEEKKEELDRLPVQNESPQEDAVIQQNKPQAPELEDTVPTIPETPQSSRPTSSGTIDVPGLPNFPNTTGWYRNDAGEYYLAGGKPVTGWQIIDQRRYQFNTDGLRTSRTGIDVSGYQGSIDWSAVAEDDISFAIVRIGGQYYRQEGGFYEDTYFERNYSGALSEGLAVGVYFFSQATTVEEAKEEALWVLNKLNGRPLSLPIMYDLEDPAPDSRFHLANLNRQEVTNLALAFCETIEANGYDAGVYTNPNWIENKLYLNQLSRYPLWLANYTSSLLPYGTDTWTWWQYTSVGRVNGISGNVDINVMR